MTDYTYITVHMALDERHALLGARDHQLSREMVEWLNSNVGEGCPNNLSWYVNLDNDAYQWYHYGINHNPDGSLVRTFMFRNEQQALMFKLVWAGK